MGYVPKEAKWFIAELIEEIRVEGENRNVLHRNLTLIEADSPDDAYRRVMELGQANEAQYVNPDGARVSIRFRGVSHLDVIHDQLEHGAELLFRAEVGVDEKRIEELVRRKEELNLFRPIEKPQGPNFASAEIVDEVARAIGVAKGHTNK